MQTALVVISCIAGAAVCGLLGLGWSLMGAKAADSRIEMWRLGAEGGPSERDRAYAYRRYKWAVGTSWMVRPVVFVFTALSALFGGGLGLVVAQVLEGAR